MAVPKRKSSHARKNKRRNNVWKLQAPALSTCSNCGAYKAPHRVCKACGYYNGREVIVMEDED
ncbi:MAG: 50S ribosomal protein L32 [Clostridia bacterium]|nr:50S ribosomal protein L32 [Clostridia bacterium]